MLDAVDVEIRPDRSEVGNCLTCGRHGFVSLAGATIFDGDVPAGHCPSCLALDNAKSQLIEEYGADFIEDRRGKTAEDFVNACMSPDVPVWDL